MTRGVEPREWLMAHRGAPTVFPENSLPGMRAALEAGARHVEFDVQLTADRVPVVAHDDLLQRISGAAGSITGLTLGELNAMPAGEAARFGERYAELRFPTLEAMLRLVREYPAATAYVELKRASMRRFGAAAVVDAAMPMVRAAGGACVVLSFDPEMVRLARFAGAPRCGLALEDMDSEARQSAEQLQPDFLFISAEQLDPQQASPLWPGPWQWVVYDVNDWDACQLWRARGAALIETDRILEFLACR